MVTKKRSAPSAKKAPRSKQRVEEEAPTRRRRAPEEARRLLLETTQKLLADHGPDAVGLKDVAAAAGVSHALVSHYFGTREALIDEALAQHFRSTRELFLEHLKRSDDEGPAAWMALLFEQLSHPLYGRLVAWSMLSGKLEHEDFFPRKEKSFRVVADALQARLEAQLGPEHPLTREDIEFGLLLAFSAGVGYVLSRSVLWASLGRTPSPQRDEDFRERLTRLIVSLVPPPSSAPSSNG